jgi:hypothetical protein
MSENDNGAYVQPRGRFHGTKCGNCRCKFVSRNAGPGMTLWCSGHPGRVCMVCVTYAICWKCYSGCLRENTRKNGSDSRLTVRTTRSHAAA